MSITMSVNIIGVVLFVDCGKNSTLCHSMGHRLKKKKKKICVMVRKQQPETELTAGIRGGGGGLLQNFKQITFFNQTRQNGDF